MRHDEDLFDLLDDDRDSLMGGTLSRLSGWMFARPGSAIATVAFVGLFGYISGNAVWQQPEARSNAFFSTRDLPAQQPAMAATEIAPVETADLKPQLPRQPADPQVARVQDALKTLKLYDGEVDGVAGSRTRNAIIAYQTILNRPATGIIDNDLLDLLDAAERKVAAVERGGDDADVVASITPTPRPERAAAKDAPAPSVAAPAGPVADQRILQLQAGLKQFGNPDMVVDGIMGSRTRKAIREFQMIFRLPETGEPDEAVFAELRKQGFIN